MGVDEEEWPEGSCDPDVVLDPSQYHDGLNVHHYQDYQLQIQKEEDICKLIQTISLNTTCSSMMNMITCSVADSNFNF